MTSEASTTAAPAVDPTAGAPLRDRVALVAGATRGAGRAMAVELARAGALVWVTGRTTRERVSEVGRAGETIEGTADLATAAGREAGSGGRAVAVPTDHLRHEEVRALVERIDAESGRLDLLVNDVWGADHLVEDRPLWEHDPEKGLRALRLGVETHLITSRYALPLLMRRSGGLLVEVTDGTAESNRDYRAPLYYDLAKNAPIRIARCLAGELRPHGASVVCLTPGWLRSEAMLDTHFGVTEETWREGTAKDPAFAISESPVYVARALVALAADPAVARWSGRSLSVADLAREYGFTDADGSRPDAWGFLTARARDASVDPADFR
ncbi:SDR family oxidoreductase [Streptomyces calidiresistens]|uniref:SDR family NAD(P)-dependent oxidoreductase n=1 Tax=Streptomyces calidiresistens TaxID=1485586 RepID=A0A7W3XXM4_9ACTN|nr:SDR family oxidoreductase [Streptomyces calidiresistens]MBB0231084.1 SDR family NAD(P)-dependent oxidoreductase [Streptomyces calidiresistens]